MTFTENPGVDAETLILISQSVVKYNDYAEAPGPRWLLVDTAHQHMFLVRGHTPGRGWPISTASAGLDNRQDSGGTPPGLHRIAEKIGAGCPSGTIFANRQDTGLVWPTDQAPTPDADLILTRILTLAGCEPGLNQGPGVDSLARYIYLHGTNDEVRIGQPVSHGCIRLTNAHIVEVFDLVHQGDPVVII